MRPLVSGFIEKRYTVIGILEARSIRKGRSFNTGAMFQKAREWLALKNYQYQVTTGIYMLEPWERTIFNATLVTILGMSVYSTYAYLPAYIHNVLSYLGYIEETQS